MDTRTTMVTAIVAGASVVAFWGPALAQTGSTTTGPTQADFDQCNREAELRAGASASPSATHRAGAPAAGTSLGTQGVGIASTVTSGTGVAAGSPGTGSIGSSSSAATVPTPSGVTSGGAASAGTSAAGAGIASGGSLSGGSTLTHGPTTSSDAQLRGIAAAGHGDSAYQAAYRDCMRLRGF